MSEKHRATNTDGARSSSSTTLAVSRSPVGCGPTPSGQLLSRASACSSHSAQRATSPTTWRTSAGATTDRTRRRRGASVRLRACRPTAAPASSSRRVQTTVHCGTEVTATVPRHVERARVGSAIPRLPRGTLRAVGGSPHLRGVTELLVATRPSLPYTLGSLLPFNEQARTRSASPRRRRVGAVVL